MKRLTSDKEITLEMAGSIPRLGNICPSSETKEMNERKLVWPKVTGTIDDRFRITTLDLLDRDKIEQTARMYRLGFPELFGGVYENLHFPTRYGDLIEQMKILILQDMQNGKIASAWALTPSEANMSVEFSLTVTDPDYRGRGLCKKFTKKVDKLVKEAGAEQGIVYCATFHKATQKIFEKLGFEKQAVLRGFIVANVGNGRYARDNVVMYTKFYNGAERLCPLKMQLLERV